MYKIASHKSLTYTFKDISTALKLPINFADFKLNSKPLYAVTAVWKRKLVSDSFTC